MNTVKNIFVVEFFKCRGGEFSRRNRPGLSKNICGHKIPVPKDLQDKFEKIGTKYAAYRGDRTIVCPKCGQPHFFGDAVEYDSSISVGTIQIEVNIENFQIGNGEIKIE